MIDRMVRQEWLKGKHDRQKGEAGMAERGGQDRSKGGSGMDEQKRGRLFVVLFLCSARDSNPRPTD